MTGANTETTTTATPPTPQQQQEKEDAVRASLAAAHPLAASAGGYDAQGRSIDDVTSAFDQERFRRARMHMGSLGDVRGSEPLRQWRPSLLTPFFGPNTVDTTRQEFAHVHPCVVFSRDVHRCLEIHHNDFNFCQTHVALLQQCLNEFKL